MFPDVQPTSELAYSQAESLEILDALIDKMNPLLRELYYDGLLVGQVSRQYGRPKLETRLETKMLPPQSSVQPRLRGHQATQIDYPR
jgi:hypothetical protein